MNMPFDHSGVTTPSAANPGATALSTMDFHGDQIVTFQANGEPHVAMRRIVENMGLSWGSQREKLIGRFNCTDIDTVGADGKVRSMTAVPVRMLPLWLATINANKVRADLRERVELYQAESAIALHDYWTKGVAVRGDMEGLVTDLDPSARAMMGGIMKGVVNRALKELVADILPALIAQEIASHQYGVVRGLTAGAVIELAGIKNRKGLRALPNLVSHRLRRYHAEKGRLVSMASLGRSSAYVFDHVTAREWLDGGGKSQIEAWIAERRGQGTLRLV